MSLKKVEQVKKDKFFKIWDVLIYGIIAAVIVSLFLAVFFTADHSELREVQAFYRDELLFTYNFPNDELTVSMADNISSGESEDGNTLTITFCTDEGNLETPKDYNIIVIKKQERSVSVTDSDCDAFGFPDCVFSSAITNNASLPISCRPHNLYIEAVGYKSDSPILPVG